MTIQIWVFTSPTCPHCPPAKEAVKQAIQGESDVVYTELSMGTQEGFDEAKKLGITSVPTTIIYTEGMKELIGIQGARSPDSFKKAIAKARKEKKTSH